MDEKLLLEVGVIAIRAGEKILEFYGSSAFELKEDRTPVTAADLASNQYICDSLESISEYPICSEERVLEYEARRDLPYFWLIDPLDGTKDFLAKNDGFTVNIALIANHKPVLGVVYAPALRRFYGALKDYGAYRIMGDLLQNLENLDTEWLKQQMKPLAGKRQIRGNTLVGCDSIHNSSEATKAFFKKYNLKRIVRGSSLKICTVAEGRADLYPRLNGTKEWDTAAGDIVLQEAGGEMIDCITKEPLLYNKENMRNNHFIAFAKTQIGGRIYRDSTES